MKSKYNDNHLNQYVRMQPAELRAENETLTAQLQAQDQELAQLRVRGHIDCGGVIAYPTS
jgi:hypothetical protein